MHEMMYTIRTSEFCLVGVFFRREFPVIVLLRNPLKGLKRDCDLSYGVFPKIHFVPLASVHV